MLNRTIYHKKSAKTKWTCVQQVVAWMQNTLPCRCEAEKNIVISIKFAVFLCTFCHILRVNRDKNNSTLFFVLSICFAAHKNRHRKAQRQKRAGKKCRQSLFGHYNKCEQRQLPHSHKSSEEVDHFCEIGWVSVFSALFAWLRRDEKKPCNKLSIEIFKQLHWCSSFDACFSVKFFSSLKIA